MLVASIIGFAFQLVQMGELDSQYMTIPEALRLVLPVPQVRLSRVGSRTVLLPKDSQVKPPAARDLVYLAASPDFCRLDPDNGIPGTAGRRCNGKDT